MSRKEGFTLVELMIVIGIVGILSAIAIPSFKQYIATSKRSEAMTQLSAMHRGAVAYYNTEIAHRGLTGGMGNRLCTTEPTNDTWTPALPTSSSQLAGKQFGDFSTLTPWQDLSINHSGMFYYSYTMLGGPPELDQCDVTSASTSRVYLFRAAALKPNGTAGEVIDFMNTVQNSEMIGGTGVVISEWTL